MMSFHFEVMIIACAIVDTQLSAWDDGVLSLAHCRFSGSSGPTATTCVDRSATCKRSSLRHVARLHASLCCSTIHCTHCVFVTLR